MATSTQAAPRRWRRPGETAAWFVLTVLAALGMSGTAVVLAGFALIVPGLILAAAPTAWLYLVAAQYPRWTWRLTRNPFATFVAAAMALGLFAVPALLVNKRIAAEVRQFAAGDFDRLASIGPPRTLLLTGPSLECDELCRRVLDTGQVRQVLVAKAPAGDGAGLEPLGPAAAFRRIDGGALERVDVAQATAQVVVVQRQVQAPFDGPEGRWSLRLNPLSLGPRRIRRVEVWRCPTPAPCVQAFRRTQADVEPLWPMLVLGFDNHNSGMNMWRAWQRSERTIGETDMAALVARVIGQPLPTQAREREIQPSMAAIEAELVAAAREDREPHVPMLGGVVAPWSEQDTLTAEQLAFLRTLVAHPTLRNLPFDWDAHPEAANAVAPLLGAALLVEGRDDTEFKASIQRAMSNLSRDRLRSQQGALLAWVKRPGVLNDRNANGGFVIRLGDLGPPMVVALSQAMEPEQGRYGQTYPVRQAVIAMCRMGPEARPAAAWLHREMDKADPGSGLHQATALALARVEGGQADPATCLTAPDLRVTDAWMARAKANAF